MPPKYNPKLIKPPLTFRESLSVLQFEFRDIPLHLIYKAVSAVQAWVNRARQTAYVEVRNKRRQKGDLV